MVHNIDVTCSQVYRIPPSYSRSISEFYIIPQASKFSALNNRERSTCLVATTVDAKRTFTVSVGHRYPQYRVIESRRNSAPLQSPILSTNYNIEYRVCVRACTHAYARVPLRRASPSDPSVTEKQPCVPSLVRWNKCIQGWVSGVSSYGRLRDAGPAGGAGNAATAISRVEPETIGFRSIARGQECAQKGSGPCFETSPVALHRVLLVCPRAPLSRPGAIFTRATISCHACSPVALAALLL